MALQEHADKVIILVEMMMMGAKDLPCFKDGELTVKTLKERFFPTGKRMNETESGIFIDSLIEESYGNWRTRVYDKIQFCCQGIV
jgi:phosphatidylinositol kinase/protein kinase (PI-3  family)